MTDPKVEWRQRHAFHEFAEVVGIPTDQIVAVKNATSGRSTVLYTDDPDATKADPVQVVMVERGPDKVLHIVPGTRGHIANFWGKLEDQLGRELPGE